MLRKSLQINPIDNVRMVLEDSFKGDTIETADGPVTLREDIEFAHKAAIKDLKAGDAVIKYGEEIGRMMTDAPKGTWIHNHNMSCERGTK
ncbi:MAG: UxaA family hydrolase [Pyramidobacter sp.]|nr:UxaA family hydrolase [Pyramidobacter sp.]